MTDEHWLTEKQMEVLKLREKGLSQSEISERMDSTRSNISAIERNARKNIEKSRRTLEAAKVLRAPISLEISEGTKIYDIARIIFEKGNEEDIDINLSGPELLREVRKNVKSALQEKKIQKPIKIGINERGEVSVSVQENSEEN